MQSHSSIFSFDTLQVHFGIPRGFLTAIVLLAALDFGLSRANWPYRVHSSSYVGAFLSVERSFNRNPAEPRIIILGNSRSKCGLLPRELERLMNLPEGTVANASIESGDHYDNRLFQERNRQRMKSARLLIYCADAYQWNDRFPLSDRFHHFAGLLDRLYLEPSAETLFGYFFRTAEKTALYHAVLRKLDALLAAATQPAATRVSFWYKNFALSSARHSLLKEIVRRAQEDGQRVLVLQLPFQDEHMRETLRSYGADYDAYKEAIRSLNRVTVALFENASDCGLQPSDFQDWDHLNPTGAAKFTQFLYDYLNTHDKDDLLDVPATR